METESGFPSGEQLYPDAESNHERFKDLVLGDKTTLEVDTKLVEEA